jgi:xylulokinase
MAVCRELDALARAGSPTDELRVSGGGARLPLLGKLKANLLNRPVVHLDADATAVGVALLAATSVGYGNDVDRAIAAMVRRARRFEPEPTRRELMEERARLFNAELVRA